MIKNLPQFSIGLIAVTAVCCLTACSSKSQEVTFKSGGMTHTFTEGQSAIPKDFPLPLYPNSTATGSVSAQGDKSDEDAKFLMLTSSDPYEQVGTFYQENLKSSGWTVGNVQTLPQFINITANKGPLEANVMLSSDGSKTNISLAISKEGADSETVDTSEQYSPNNLTPPTD